MVFLGLYFMSFFSPPLALPFLRKCIDNMFPPQLSGAIKWLIESLKFCETQKSNDLIQVKANGAFEQVNGYSCEQDPWLTI